MSDIFAFTAAFIAVQVFKIIMFKKDKDYSGYDERQELIRGRAFRYGFLTLAALLAAAVLWEECVGALPIEFSLLTPFFMYGEVCARFGSVQYRGQDNLSPYYYTWKAPQDLMDGFDGSQSYWDTQEIYDSGTGYDAKLMPLCEKDNADSPESNNTFMLNGACRQPVHSHRLRYNGLHLHHMQIQHLSDFPLHIPVRSRYV